MHNYPSLARGVPPAHAHRDRPPPPRSTIRRAMVFRSWRRCSVPDGTMQAFRPFPSRRDAEGFLQAFMQEKAGEYGLSEHRDIVDRRSNR